MEFKILESDDQIAGFLDWERNWGMDGDRAFDY